MLVVRRFMPGDARALEEIVRALPDYFTDDVPDKVETDSTARDTWVLVDTDQVVGFAIAEQRPPRAAEILWMAIASAHRHRGEGSLLLNAVLDDLGAGGVSVVEVKTLDKSSDYTPYEATRGFWEARGFVHVDTIDPLPGWQEGNPAAVYIAALRSTRPTPNLSGELHTTTPADADR
jgi:ribosomal protein S18 acetylase RimI-like enzyme